MAIALVRHRFHGRRAANLLIVLPMATPEIVMGASLLSMFLIYGISLGFTSLLIAHIMFSISFVVVVVRSRLIGFDRSIEEAAADLGAGPFTTFRTVTLPLLAPGIVAAALLAFALSIDDFIVSDFNKGTTETFPLYVFGAHLRGIPVQVNVLATMLFASPSPPSGWFSCSNGELSAWHRSARSRRRRKPLPLFSGRVAGGGGGGWVAVALARGLAREVVLGQEDVDGCRALDGPQERAHARHLLELLLEEPLQELLGDPVFSSRAISTRAEICSVTRRSWASASATGSTGLSKAVCGASIPG